MIKKLFSFVYVFLRDVYRTPQIFKVVKQQTYFPELQQKKKSQQIIENLKWLYRYHEINRFYKLYGMDIDGVLNDEYMDYRAFMDQRNEINGLNRTYSQVTLLRDKFMFFEYLKSLGVKTPEVFALIINGKLLNCRFEQDDSVLLNERDYFIKAIDGECASFVKHVEDYEEYQKIRTNLKTGKFICQKRLKQGNEINKINPGSVNTLRIVTFNPGNGISPYVLAAVIRIGNEKSGYVDNFAAGGIAVVINDDGTLDKYGYFKPPFGTKTDRHPDTGVVFSEFTIPNYEQIKEYVCKCHNYFYDIKAIGWDVAIEEGGGISLIEGNDNWEISLQQIGMHPLREKWENAFRSV